MARVPPPDDPSNGDDDDAGHPQRQADVVNAYLGAVAGHSGRRGVRRAAENLRRRLEGIEVELLDASAIQRLNLVQERMNIESELAQLDPGPDIAVLERAFLKVAESYGNRKGISYEAWRELGVRPSVLKQAGIRRHG